MSEVRRKAFMFVRYPEASGPRSIMRLLGSLFNFHHSYEISDLLKDSYSLVVIPGGTAAKQAKDLQSEGLAIIKKFVSDGGSYLGICAGGYLACFPELKLLESVEYILPKKKSNFKGTINVELEESCTQEKFIVPVYYQNGPVFNIVGNDSNIYILATITDIGEIGWPDMIGKPAVVFGRYGDGGKVLLVGPHFETSKGTSQYFVNFASRL